MEKEKINTIMRYEDVAREYNIKVGTLHSLVHRGLIPFVRVSKRLILFKRLDIEDWLDSQKVPVKKNTAKGGSHE